ncbi:MAG: chemotaxis protein CheW, partial [Halothiobacillaceae bacterium]
QDEVLQDEVLQDEVLQDESSPVEGATERDAAPRTEDGALTEPASVTATGEAVGLDDSGESLPEGMLFGEEFAEPEEPAAGPDGVQAEEITVSEYTDTADEALGSPEPDSGMTTLADEQGNGAVLSGDDCPVRDDPSGTVYLVGRSGPLWLALPADQVDSVLDEDARPEPVRGAPAQIAGSVARQGRRALVLDLGVVTRGEAAQVTGRVAMVAGGRWGVRWDSAPVERRLAPERFAWAGSMDERARPWLAGVARGERLVVLDVDGLRQVLRA